MMNKDEVFNSIIVTGSVRKDINIDLRCLNNLPKTRELELAITRIEEGIMWLDKGINKLHTLKKEQDED